jgi:hypothetical protein
MTYTTYYSHGDKKKPSAPREVLTCVHDRNGYIHIHGTFLHSASACTYNSLLAIAHVTEQIASSLPYPLRTHTPFLCIFI